MAIEKLRVFRFEGCVVEEAFERGANRFLSKTMDLGDLTSASCSGAAGERVNRVNRVNTGPRPTRPLGGSGLAGARPNI